MGLAYDPVSTKLEIWIVSAYDLPSVNRGGKTSDPYAKVTVFKVNASKETIEVNSFKTKTKWNVSDGEAKWNQKYVSIAIRKWLLNFDLILGSKISMSCRATWNICE